MNKIYLKLIFLIFFWPISFALEEDCRTWFEQARLKKDKNCLTECVILDTDMGTFHCPSQCESLCKSLVKEQTILKLSYFYPGLTEKERALVDRYPKKMLSAYMLTHSAEKLCLTIFKDSGTNDASDACRHFVWSALLYKKFGLNFSQKILNAHEDNPKQPQ